MDQVFYALLGYISLLSVLRHASSSAIADVLASAYAATRLYCWSDDLTPELCCSTDELPLQCQFDRFFFTRAECCATNYTIVNPYLLTTPPPLSFPALGASWESGHQAVHPEQRNWEAMLGPAAQIQQASTDLQSMADEGFRVYKGDAADANLYGLDRWAADPQNLAVTRIVDVGGNYGVVAIAIARLFPEARVVVLEPNPLLCRFILWNVREKGLMSRIWPICGGLGARMGVMSMAQCNDPWRGAALTGCIKNAMSTFPRHTIPDAAQQSVIDVPILTMDEILTRLQWATVDVLKIDCDPS